MKAFLGRALVLAALFVGLLSPLVAGPVAAVDNYAVCNDPVNAQTDLCKKRGDRIDGTVKNLINVLLFITGVISVGVGIAAGIMYATSAGDQAAVTKAKNALMYAVIGLVVALLGFAVVNWVVNLF